MGERVKLIAELDTARTPLQIDIGYGDAFTAPAQKIEYPTLLDMPAPHLRAYPRESVIAEKFHVMVLLGMGNSRIKGKEWQGEKGCGGREKWAKKKALSPKLWG